MKPAAGTGGSARVLIVDDEKEIHEDFEDMPPAARRFGVGSTGGRLRGPRKAPPS